MKLDNDIFIEYSLGKNIILGDIYVLYVITFYGIPYVVEEAWWQIYASLILVIMVLSMACCPFSVKQQPNLMLIYSNLIKGINFSYFFFQSINIFKKASWLLDNIICKMMAILYKN